MDTNVSLAKFDPTPTEAQMKNWQLLAKKKNEVFEELKKKELATQGILLNVADDKLADKLAEYDKAFTDLVEYRLSYTNQVRDALITKAMEFEKRVDPKNNETYKTLDARELLLREEKQKTIDATNDLNAEKTKFKTHFINEFTRLSTDFRTKCLATINEAYNACLYAKTPPGQAPNTIKVVEQALDALVTPQPNKFVRTLVSNVDAKELFAGLVKPDYKAIRKEYVEDLKTKFSLYPNDLANAATAIKTNNEQTTQVTQKMISESNQTVAANELMALAENVTVAEPGFKGVTEVSKIKLFDNDQKWVAKVIVAFVKNFEAAFPKLRTKKYSQISVAQMAAALDNANLKIEGIEYEIIKS